MTPRSEIYLELYEVIILERRGSFLSQIHIKSSNQDLDGNNGSLHQMSQFLYLDLFD